MTLLEPDADRPREQPQPCRSMRAESVPADPQRRSVSIAERIAGLLATRARAASTHGR